MKYHVRHVTEVIRIPVFLKGRSNIFHPPVSFNFKDFEMCLIFLNSGMY